MSWVFAARTDVCNWKDCWVFLQLLFRKVTHFYKSLSTARRNPFLKQYQWKKLCVWGDAKSTSCHFVQKCTFNCSKQAAIFQKLCFYSAKSLFPRKMQWHHQGVSVWIGETITETIVHVALKPFAIHVDQSQFLLSSCVISVHSILPCSYGGYMFRRDAITT